MREVSSAQSNVPSIHSLCVSGKNVTEIPYWDDFPPANLIETLRLKSTTTDQHEIARVEWFWRRRPKILCANLVFAFSYLSVLVCLFYYLPQTIFLLLVWIGARSSCFLVDCFRFVRWRNEYESSIKRAIIRLSDQK